MCMRMEEREREIDVIAQGRPYGGQLPMPSKEDQKQKLVIITIYN